MKGVQAFAVERPIGQEGGIPQSVGLSYAVMPSILAADERPSWPSRYRALADPARRPSDLVAGTAVALLIAQLALAQLTLAMVACLAVTGRLSRWRPLWLAVPAAGGSGSWR